MDHSIPAGMKWPFPSIGIRNMPPGHLVWPFVWQFLNVWYACKNCLRINNNWCGMWRNLSNDCDAFPGWLSAFLECISLYMFWYYAFTNVGLLWFIHKTYSRSNHLVFLKQVSELTKKIETYKIWNPNNWHL